MHTSLDSARMLRQLAELLLGSGPSISGCRLRLLAPEGDLEDGFRVSGVGFAEVCV